MLGWISRRPPDLDASLYVLPIVLLLGWVIGTSVGRIAPRDLDAAIAISLGAVVIHLMISGGWTVPGVAILIWLGAGMLVPEGVAERGLAAIGPAADGNVASSRIHDDQTGGERPQEALRRFPWLAPLASVAIGSLLLMSLWYFSLQPVQQRKLWMDRTTVAQAQNRHRFLCEHSTQGSTPIGGLPTRFFGSRTSIAGD